MIPSRLGYSTTWKLRPTEGHVHVWAPPQGRLPLASAHPLQKEAGIQL